MIVGVSGYSRTIAARMIPSREAHDILLGHLACLLELGGVPRSGVYDNEAALVSRHNGRADVDRAVPTVPGHARHGRDRLQARRPRSQGPRRAGQRLSRDQLPARAGGSPRRRTSTRSSPTWLRRANNRIHSTLRCRPSDRIVEDRAAMMALPPVLPDPAWRETKRLGRDHWVRIGTCDYSVHPRAIGRRVEVRMDLDEVVVTCAGDDRRPPRRGPGPSTARSPTPPMTIARKVMRAVAAAVADRRRRRGPRPVGL